MWHSYFHTYNSKFLVFIIKTYSGVKIEKRGVVSIMVLLTVVPLDIENCNICFQNVPKEQNSPLKSKRRRHAGIPGLRTQELDAGLWTLNSRRWTLDSGRWTLNAGRWTLNPARWMLDSGYSTLDSGP